MESPKQYTSNMESCYSYEMGRYIVKNTETGRKFCGHSREEAYAKARADEDKQENMQKDHDLQQQVNEDARMSMKYGDPNLQEIRFEAHREPVSFRYDLIDANFLHALALLKGCGAAKYGDTAFLSGLSGGKSPANHIMGHLHQYRTGQAYDHTEIGGDSTKFHLVAIALNCMMEWQLIEQKELDNQKEKA